MFRLVRIRPPHGWNAVWWELGIVTLGVLLALAAQELVQRVHRDSEVAAARESLNTELAGTKYAALERIKDSECVKRTLVRLDELIDNDRVQMTQLEIGTLRLWPTSAWDAAVASGAVGNMETGERNTYANLVSMARVLAELNLQEFEAVSNLRTLSRHPAMTEVSRDRLAQQIAKVRSMNSLLTLASRQWLEHANALDIKLTDEEEAELAETPACVMPDEALESPGPSRN